MPCGAYNDPIDPTVDRAPRLIARLHGEGLIVGVKEVTGDVRSAYEIKELAPEVDLLIGTDDTVVEMGLAGAVGWVAAWWAGGSCSAVCGGGNTACCGGDGTAAGRTDRHVGHWVSP